MTVATKLRELWSSARTPPTLEKIVEAISIAPATEVLDALKLDQYHRWQTSEPISVEAYLEYMTKLPEGTSWELELLIGEISARRSAGRAVTEEEIIGRFPQHIGHIKQIQDCLSGKSLMETLVAENHLMDSASDSSFRLTPPETLVIPAKDLRSAGQAGAVAPPQAVGESTRYRFDQLIGQGAFGRVYKGFDIELQRSVAIKVPDESRFLRPEDKEMYLSEARMLAALEHPHILPVYDVAKTEVGTCLVVSKLIDGSELTQFEAITNRYDQITALLACVCDALQHSHSRGIIHRDIKPSNILIDRAGVPYLADFGLAIKDEEVANCNASAGTPAYMSPEQVRGEGHLVSGQSDIFSMGVVMYELLTGSRPFRAATISELLREICETDPAPPEATVESIPAELSRICMKALSKRAVDRYANAADLAGELRSWQVAATDVIAVPPRFTPRGFRSFDANDSDSFLRLLPGPRDRHGIPESLRFWKTRVEELDPDQTFRVGVVYGPSGCGKSSFLKAGLLPRLSKHVQAVFVESGPDRLEEKLRDAVCRACPEIDRNTCLVDALAMIRRGRSLPRGRKLFIVIDQFEQWLNTQHALESSELLRALRQCDGQRIQVLLIIRDDFWMAVSELFRSLEVPLQEGQNTIAFSLFDNQHAANVLREYGVAYRRLPASSEEIRPEQLAFIQQAVAQLSQNGKVICMRLALFAEMMKSRTWTTMELRGIGGATGLGTLFLEETFDQATSPVAYRVHRTAIRRVLSELVPSDETVIRGQLKTKTELKIACGYENRESDFDLVIHILERDLHLITLVNDSGDLDSSESYELNVGYQLTHDFLVPSLHDWFTRKQRETLRGRAELRLANQTVIWERRRESRFLPTLMDFLSISALADRRRWTGTQRQMMKSARKYYQWRFIPVAVLFLAVFAVTASLYLRAAEERRSRLQTENRERERKAFVVSEANRSLERGTQSLQRSDYSLARLEQQRLSSISSELRDQEIYGEVRDFLLSVEAVSQFEEARVQRCGMPSCQFNYKHYHPADVFRSLEIDIEQDTVDTICERVGRTMIEGEILAAIDDWIWVISASQSAAYRQLLPKLVEVANRIDPDSERVKVRKSVLPDSDGDVDPIQLLCRLDTAKLRPPEIVFIANLLNRRSSAREAMYLLLEAAARYPTDFWVNLRLAEISRQVEGELSDLSLKHLEIARALRPDNPIVLNNLAAAYQRRGMSEIAMQLLQDAQEKSPADALLKHSFATLLTENSDSSAAIEIYEDVVREFPSFSPSFLNLAVLKFRKGDVEESLRLLDRGIELLEAASRDPSTGIEGTYNLGVAKTIAARLRTEANDRDTALLLHNAGLQLLREVAAIDAGMESKLEYELLIAADFADDLGDTTRRIRLLKEAASFGREQRGYALFLLSNLFASLGNTDEALKSIREALTCKVADKQLSANIAVFAAILQTQELQELGHKPGRIKAKRDSMVNDATRYLAIAFEKGFFQPVPFGLMLMQRPEFEGLRQEPVFLAFVSDVFRTAYQDSPEAFHDFETPAAYFAARASLGAGLAFDFAAERSTDSCRAEFRAFAYECLLAGFGSTWRVGQDDTQEPRVQGTLGFWKIDPALSSIREESELERLAPDERKQWKEFWLAVDKRIEDRDAPFPRLNSRLHP